MIPKFRAWLKEEKKMVEILSIDFKSEEFWYRRIRPEPYGGFETYTKFSKANIMPYI